MATKDWKKVTFDDGSFKYVNKKRNGTLYIFDEKKVSITIDTVNIGGGKFPKTSIYEEFKTKSQALRFAQSYIRKH